MKSKPKEDLSEKWNLNFQVSDEWSFTMRVATIILTIGVSIGIAFGIPIILLR
jgi:hypothetical protein